MTICVIGALPISLLKFRGDLLLSMVKHGHRVVACAASHDPVSGTLGDTAGGLAEMGVEYRTYPLSRTGQNPLADMITLVTLWRLFREIKPDLALTYTVKPVVYGSMAARLAHVPRRYAMITGLSMGLRDESARRTPQGRLVRSLLRVSLANNDCVFFQNPDDQDLFSRMGLMRKGARRQVVNGSGVDLDHYRLVAPITEPMTFLLIARLLSDKGIREYVEAGRLLKRAHPNARLLLVGPFERHPLSISRSDVESWQREGAVDYAGPVSDVRPYIEQSSVYVLPSYREGTPRTVLEAMAMGRPIITTDAPGCRETVEHGENGFLVPVADPVSLAAAMARFAASPELIPRMGLSSRRIAEQKYDVRKVNRVLMEAMGLDVPVLSGM